MPMVRSVVVVSVALVCLVVEAQAQEIEAQQQQAIERARNDFTARMRRLPVGRSDRSRRQEFRDDVRTFRNELVGLWTLRFAPMTEEWARKDLEARSEDLGDTLERMREHVDRGSDPPDFEPGPLEGQTLAERLDLLVMVGLRLRNTVIEVTDGDVLDLRQLNAVRSDFATLEAWAEEFRDLARGR